MTTTPLDPRGVRFTLLADAADESDRRDESERPSLEFSADGEPVVPNVLIDLGGWLAAARERDVNTGPGPGHQLRDYWVRGPGAAKIRWNTEGDGTRCIRLLRKYVRDPGGLCQEYHRQATGKSMHPHPGRLTEGLVPVTFDVDADDPATCDCAATSDPAVTAATGSVAAHGRVDAAGDCPPGHHAMPDGTCMADDDPAMRDSYALAPASPTAADPGGSLAPVEGVLTVEGVESGDGRMFGLGSLAWDEPPLPLMWQKETSHGGKSDVSVRVGSVTHVWREPLEGRDDVNLIRARGFIDLANADGAEAFRRMANETLTGNSVDVDSVKGADVELIYAEAESGDVADEGVVEAARPFAAPEMTLYHGGRIRGTTLVEFPAFTEARLALAENGDGVERAASPTPPTSHSTPTSDDVWDPATVEVRLPRTLPVATAAAAFAVVVPGTTVTDEVPVTAGRFLHHEVDADGRPGPANLTAVSAALGRLAGPAGDLDADRRRAAYEHLAAHLRDAGRVPPPLEEPTTDPVTALTAASHTITIPDLPPAEWFEEPVDVTPLGALTVTDAGRVYGYLAPLGVRHRSFADRSVYVPLRNVDYTRFHGGETIVAGGGRVVTGPITMNCGHLSPTPGFTTTDALEHYDNSCSVVASVRVGASRSGVWVAGALLPGVTPAQVARMLTCRLSGDWRPHLDRPGWRELAAALLVPVPGFPLARAASSVSVSDGALVASSVPVRLERDAEARRRAARRMARRLGAGRYERVSQLRDRLGVAAESVTAGGPSAAARERAAAAGEALPDGSYPVRDVAELRDAIQAYGRARDKAATRRHIMRRARALHREDLIPESWRAAASLAERVAAGERRRVVAGLRERVGGA